MDLGIGYNLYAGRKFSTTAPAESPLQQAVIAAWDMQEESGPLLPAKGGIEIPAFNSPGFTASGPAEGISARNIVRASSQYFQYADTGGVFSLEGHVIRAWAKWTLLDIAFPMAFGKSTDLGVGNVDDEWSLFSQDTGGIRFRTRNASNSSFETNVNFAGLVLDTWYRIEIDGITSRIRIHDLGGVERVNAAIVVPPTFGTSPMNIGGPGSGGFTGDQFGFVVLDRALTTEERTADLTPRLFSQL